MNEGFQAVAKAAQLSEGQILPVSTTAGKEVLLIKLVGSVFAIQAVCSHREAWLDAGSLHPESMEIQCPFHEGRFDLRSGAPTRLPPTEPIQTYQVQIQGDDVLLGPPKGET